MIIFSKTFRRILNDSQTPAPTPPTTIVKAKRKTVTLPAIETSSMGATSTPSTPVEPPPPSPINSIVLMRTRSPNKSSPVVVVPRQTAEHCKQTSHITARPNSMI